MADPKRPTGVTIRPVELIFSGVYIVSDIADLKASLRRLSRTQASPIREKIAAQAESLRADPWLFIPLIPFKLANNPHAVDATLDFSSQYFPPSVDCPLVTVTLSPAFLAAYEAASVNRSADAKALLAAASAHIESQLHGMLRLRDCKLLPQVDLYATTQRVDYRRTGSSQKNVEARAAEYSRRLISSSEAFASGNCSLLLGDRPSIILYGQKRRIGGEISDIAALLTLRGYLHEMADRAALLQREVFMDVRGATSIRRMYKLDSTIAEFAYKDAIVWGDVGRLGPRNFVELKSLPRVSSIHEGDLIHLGEEFMDSAWTGNINLHSLIEARLTSLRETHAARLSLKQTRATNRLSMVAAALAFVTIFSADVRSIAGVAVHYISMLLASIAQLPR